jgi:hypothetical protein
MTVEMKDHDSLDNLADFRHILLAVSSVETGGTTDGTARFVVHRHSKMACTAKNALSAEIQDIFDENALSADSHQRPIRETDRTDHRPSRVPVSRPSISLLWRTTSDP